MILAHTAMTSAANVQRMIAAIRSSTSEAVNRHSHSQPPACAGTMTYFWPQLLERHPQRFFVGSDFKFARKIRNPPGGRKTLKKYRKLQSLPRPARQPGPPGRTADALRRAACSIWIERFSPGYL